MRWQYSSTEVAWKKFFGVLFVVSIAAIVTYLALVRHVFSPPSILTHDDPEIAQLAMRLHKERGYVWDENDCPQAWDQNQWCIILTAVSPITESQWQLLFPQTKFYLLRTPGLSKDYKRGVDGYGMSAGRSIIAEQGDQLYQDSTFGALLKANNVRVLDNNREMIAQAFALMTLGYYRERDIEFSQVGDIEVLEFGRPRSYYRIVAWTQLGEFEISYDFDIEAEKIRNIELHIRPSHRPNGIIIEFPLINTIPSFKQSYTFE